VRGALKHAIDVSSGMQPVKTIQLRYTASCELDALFENFRLMCNDAIRIALNEKPKSRFMLIELAYPRLKEYGLHSHYILSACEVAFTAYRNKDRESDPYVKRAFIKLDIQSYNLNHLLLRIPIRARQFVYLTLQGSNHHLSFIDNPRLKRGSITITPHTASIAFSNEIPETQPQGYVGVDVNERNVTIAATNGYVEQFSELAEVVEIKDRYRTIRDKIGRRTRQDRRISQQLYSRYGERERNRTIQRVHKITKKITTFAEANQFGIVMENLKGIRKLYRKGNGQGRSYRGRMNSLVFREIQRQSEYKGRWEGLPVLYVDPRGTSRNCPDCGSRVVVLAGRQLYCPECDKIWDRDVLASKNLAAALVRAARPPRRSCEGERDDDGSNPPSGWVEAKLVGCKTTKPTEP
jgi:putative transposase